MLCILFLKTGLQALSIANSFIGVLKTAGVNDFLL